jgi:hypothetical protein
MEARSGGSPAGSPTPSTTCHGHRRVRQPRPRALAAGEQLRSDQVLAAANKATDLTRQILAFSRQVLSPVPVDVSDHLGLGKIISRLLGRTSR